MMRAATTTAVVVTLSHRTSLVGASSSSQSSFLRAARPNPATTLPEDLITVDDQQHNNNGDDRSLAIANCPGETDSFTIKFDGPCTIDKIIAKTQSLIESKYTSCTTSATDVLADLLGVTVDDALGKTLCADAYKSSTAKHFDYAEITRKGNEFDNEYYSGGTYWNYEIETDDGDNHLRDDAARVKKIFEYEAQKKLIDLPTYLESFDPNQDGCDLNAAFCCWVQDRQAGDNNGNCNTPYDSQCIDKDPADNANFCYTDHSRSQPSHHTNNGFSIFGNVQNGQENIEGPIHCHGFAWAQDEETHPSGVYKGNNLFFVSMYDHMHQRGYVRNAPGSSMCACAENMAVVTRADCTEIAADEDFQFQYNVTTSTLSGVLTNVKIKFNSCKGANNNNNDLEAYYQRLVNDGLQTQDNFNELKKILVGDTKGNCNDAIVDFLKTKNIYKFGDEPPTLAPGTVEAIDIALVDADLGGDGEPMPAVPTDGDTTSGSEFSSTTTTGGTLLEDGDACDASTECKSGECTGEGICAPTTVS